jgi:Sec-independent protein secretion pathway component TatC
MTSNLRLLRIAAPFEPSGTVRLPADANRIATIHDNEEVREYYASIRDPFEQTFRSMKAANPFDWLLTSIGILLFFSVVPVLPWLLYFLVPRLIGANAAIVGGVSVPLHSFFLWYVATVLPLSTCLWAANAFSTRRREDRQKEWLALS